jgi:hypothetical protein
LTSPPIFRYDPVNSKIIHRYTDVEKRDKRIIYSGPRPNIWIIAIHGLKGIGNIISV